MNYGAHYKAVRERMGMGNKPVIVRRENIYLLPKEKAKTRRVRNELYVRNDRMRVLLKPTEIHTPNDLLGLVAGKAEVSVAEIKRIVAEHFDIPVDVMTSRKNHMHLSTARHVAIYLTRTLRPLSLNQIGMHFSMDHTTVLNAICRTVDRINASDNFAASVATVRARIAGYDGVVFWGS